MPVRVVAPTRVKRGSSSRIDDAEGPLPDDDVEPEVLHRGIQDLLDGAGQAVDLVDEQHVAVVELGQDRREVAGPLERGSGRDVEMRAHLGRDDAGQRRLAETGRTREQQVVGGLPAAASGLQQDRRGDP